MPPSKLDKYLNILEVLVRRPRKLDYIAYKVDMECSSLKRHMGFLISNGLVEKQKLSGRLVIYAINERGLSVFKTLRALKYLDKLREAREITPILSKHS